MTTVISTKQKHFVISKTYTLKPSKYTLVNSDSDKYTISYVDDDNDKCSVSPYILIHDFFKHHSIYFKILINSPRIKLTLTTKDIDVSEIDSIRYCVTYSVHYNFLRNIQNSKTILVKYIETILDLAQQNGWEYDDTYLHFNINLIIEKIRVSKQFYNQTFLYCDLIEQSNTSSFILHYNNAKRPKWKDMGINENDHIVTL